MSGPFDFLGLAPSPPAGLPAPAPPRSGSLPPAPLPSLALPARLPPPLLAARPPAGRGRRGGGGGFPHAHAAPRPLRARPLRTPGAAALPAVRGAGDRGSGAGAAPAGRRRPRPTNVSEGRARAPEEAGVGAPLARLRALPFPECCGAVGKTENLSASGFARVPAECYCTPYGEKHSRLIKSCSDLSDRAEVLESRPNSFPTACGLPVQL